METKRPWKITVLFYCAGCVASPRAGCVETTDDDKTLFQQCGTIQYEDWYPNGPSAL